MERILEEDPDNYIARLGLAYLGPGVAKAPRGLIPDAQIIVIQDTQTPEEDIDDEPISMQHLRTLLLTIGILLWFVITLFMW